MTTSKPSRFAQKLREFRATAGRNGRMTQDELADLLDVSVDAVGKYERSVSFIRGDLEHRLASGLGWSRREILECREDWENRRSLTGTARYRLLDDALVDEVFSGSWSRASRASIVLAEAELRELPDELAANEKIFLPIYETFREHWGAVMFGDQMVAKWALPFLLPEHEAQLRSRQFIEADLSVDLIRRPLFPGSYFGYCPALIVRPGHEAASSLLLTSFVSFLEDLARRDVLLHGLGTITVSPNGAQVCRDLGMTHLGSHCLDASYGVWELPGSVIPDSIFGRRSTFLRKRYSQAYGHQAAID